MFLCVSLFQLFVDYLFKLSNAELAFFSDLHDFLSHLWDFFSLRAIFLELHPAFLNQLLHLVLLGTSRLEYPLELVQRHTNL